MIVHNKNASTKVSFSHLLQAKQKENYDKKSRADRSKDFEVGEIVCYKNFRAGGLAQALIGKRCKEQ